MPRSSPRDAAGSAPPNTRAAAAPAAPAGQARARQLAWALVPLLALGPFAFVRFPRLAPALPPAP